MFPIVSLDAHWFYLRQNTLLFTLSNVLMQVHEIAVHVQFALCVPYILSVYILCVILNKEG